MATDEMLCFELQSSCAHQLNRAYLNRTHIFREQLCEHAGVNS